MTLVAVDTNVLLYALDRTAGQKGARARRILRAAPYGSIRLPLQVAGEAFKVLTGKFGWDKARARVVVTTYLDQIPILAATHEAARTAFDLCIEHSIQYWDALIVTTAVSAGCSTLLTEDLQDGRHFTVQDVGRSLQIVDPFNDANRTILSALGLAGDS